jgi:hypothetical protein
LRTCFGNSLWELALGSRFDKSLLELALKTRFRNSLWELVWELASGTCFRNLLWELTLGTCFVKSLWEFALGTCFGNSLQKLASGTRFGNSLRDLAYRTRFGNSFKNSLFRAFQGLHSVLLWTPTILINYYKIITIKSLAIFFIQSFKFITLLFRKHLRTKDLVCIPTIPGRLTGLSGILIWFNWLLGRLTGSG